MEILTFLVLFCFSKGRFFLQHFKSNVVYFPYRIWKATNFNLYNLRFLSCLISKKIYKLLQLFCIYFPSARAQLEAFYHPLSWSTAKSKCGDRGGYLAQLQTSSKVIDLTRLDAVFRPEAIYTGSAVISKTMVGISMTTGVTITKVTQVRQVSQLVCSIIHFMIKCIIVFIINHHLKPFPVYSKINLYTLTPYWFHTVSIKKFW